MPYKFGLGAFDGPTQDATNSFTVNFALGYETEIFFAVLMSVMLVNGDSYLDGKLSPVYDLQFGVRLLSLNSGFVSPPFFDRATAAQYVPSDQSHAVLMKVIDAVGLLVEASSGNHITMETYHSGLP